MTDKQTILLIEDSESDRMLIQAAVLKAHFKSSLHVVYDGEEAIAYLKGEGDYSDRSKCPVPVVVLLDLNLPKVDGFQVLAWVRSQPRLKRIPVIILSGASRSEDVERAFDLGATGFLVKPTGVGELQILTGRLRDWLEINHFPASPE